MPSLVLQLEICVQLWLLQEWCPGQAPASEELQPIKILAVIYDFYFLSALHLDHVARVK